MVPSIKLLPVILLVAIRNGANDVSDYLRAGEGILLPVFTGGISVPEEKMSKQQQQLKEITERLEKGVQELFSTEQYTEYLRVMSQFHNYSFSNILLIAMQKPDATLVAGYGAWQKKFEQNVMRGEKAIKIFAPAPRKVEVEREVLDPVTQRPVLDENGEPLKEMVTVKKPFFKIASVFDVSQTEGKPLPELAQVQELTGSVEGYNLFFDALCRTSGVPIAFEPISGSTHGYYHQVEKRIAIAEDMSEAQNVKTAIHEIVHSRLHDVDMMDEANGIMIDRRTREVQAESVAYTVCQHYGIDTSDYSFGYIAGWSEGREMKELRSSMEVIRREADSMIKAIDANLEELRREQELEAENPFIDEQTVGEETPLVEGQAVEAESGNISSESGGIEIKNGVEQPVERRQTDRPEVSVREGEAIAADQPFSEAVQMPSADVAEKVTIGSFFVERDPHNLGDSHSFQTFSDLDSALAAYAALPNHIDKNIGMESTEQPPSRMTLIQCKNGMETLTDMEFESLSGKWITEESQEAWHRAQFFLDNHDTEIAYRAGNRYFTIQNTDGGYDYTFYDKAFHELDGGVYDNPDVSIREAMDDILEDAGLSYEQCEVIDHGELMKFVEAVRIGDITVVTEEENDSIPLVSDHTEPEASLGGRSRAEIEETVLSMAQAEIDEMGLSEDVKLLGARVYGSRTREGLYQEGSDVDVVLSYTGGIKESAFLIRFMNPA
ncbi:MAG: ssDNA-binding domain-containing protein [Clostridiales bacterium]|nr:ssDNA-binding domain-containing protein [Clostridiales bacterium]